MNDTIFDFGGSAPALASGSGTPWIVPAIIGGLVLVIVVVLLIVLRRLLTRPDLRGMTREEIQKHWEEIEKVAGNGQMGAKMAIVEADKLLDAALKSLTLPGTTLGERLKFAAYRYPEIKKVWFAHRLRNQLVHETTFELSGSQARAAMHEYKKALKMLNVL